MTPRRWSPFLVDPKIAQISEYVGSNARYREEVRWTKAYVTPRAMPGISHDCSLLLAVIRRYCWLFLAVIFSPLLSKNEGFCGRDPAPGCSFAGLSAVSVAPTDIS
jgi:hypothetical protein